MASSKDYADYISEQLGAPESVRWRAMMGEYILYYKEKIVGGVYDNRLLVKPVNAAKAMLPHAPAVLPYEGAKEMLLVEDVDDGAFLRALLEAVYPELPAPKKK